MRLIIAPLVSRFRKSLQSPDFLSPCYPDYLSSALRSLFNIPCSVFDIPFLSVLCLQSFVLCLALIFNQKRWYLRAKIEIFKKILTPLPTSSYENPESPIVVIFRIKRAGSSNYRGSAPWPVPRETYLVSRFTAKYYSPSTIRSVELLLSSIFPSRFPIGLQGRWWPWCFCTAGHAMASLIAAYR